MKAQKPPILIIKPVKSYLNLTHDFKDTHLHFLSTWKLLCYWESGVPPLNKQKQIKLSYYRSTEHRISLWPLV